MRVLNQYVDNREQKPSPEEWVALLREQGHAFHIMHLPIGDITWETLPDQSQEGTVTTTHVVERKSMHDLLNSVRDGRLKRYVDRVKDMHSSPHRYVFYLLVEGYDIPSFGGAHWTHDRVDSLLLSVQEEGVYTVRSQGLMHSAARIDGLIKRSTRPRMALSVPRTPDVSDDEIKFIMCLPGIGLAKARSLRRDYGSPQGVLDAFQSGVPRTKGIGLGTADGVRAFLRGDA